MKNPLHALNRWWTRREWDLTALLNAVDKCPSMAERHLWLVRWAEWLRSPGPIPVASPADEPAAAEAASHGPLPTPPGGTPWPVRRLRHFLNVLERHPQHAAAVQGLLRSVLAENNVHGLLADFGFAPRSAFGSELGERLRLSLLPRTPETRDLGELFQLVFSEPEDAQWLEAVDPALLNRLGHLLIDPILAERWRTELLESIQLLAAQVRASAFSPQLRVRMDPLALHDRPFHQLTHSAERLESLMDDPTALQQQVQYLRALLDQCRVAAASVRQHLEAYGISVDVIFQSSQLQLRLDRIEMLLDCLVSDQPAREWQRLWVHLSETLQARRGLGPLFTQHYQMLARVVAERNAESGEHYITRDAAEYRDMLHRAAGGGLVIAGTTFLKFAIYALGLSAFWGGFWAGTNYALSFVLIHLLHWTVATKQPAMTAPAMAAKLEGVSVSDEAVEGFIDEVTHLMRTQIAGIVGNLAVVAPVVLALQGLAWLVLGAPLIAPATAHHVFESLTLLGPTLIFAAFTGILLFLSSLIAGWAENWFVWHRIDSAIAWHPLSVRLLGTPRAQRWSQWWRRNISGLAANVSLGLMLGLVPALAGFVGLPVEVRHVTLSMGQLAAAAGTIGLPVLHEPGFWWTLAAIPLTGMLNLLVSFTLAFRVALRSRGLKVRERGRLYAALRARVIQAPWSFLKPPASTS